MRRFALGLLAIFTLCDFVVSQSAESVLESATLFGEGIAAIARLEMRIKSANGEKIREIELMIDHSAGKMRTIARIVSPSFLSGMKFLKIHENGKPDAQWMRTSSGIRRLGESDKSEKVFGSSFTVDDFGAISASGFDIAFAADKKTIQETAILACPKIKTSYASKIIWMDNATKLIMAIEYAGDGGKILKRYNVTQASAARDRPIDVEMLDFESGIVTYLHIISMETRSSISERNFNPGAL